MNPIVKALFITSGIVVACIFPVLFVPIAALVAAQGIRRHRRLTGQARARETLQASPTYRAAYERALWAQQRPVAVRQLHLVGQPAPVAPVSGRRASAAPERVAVVSRIRPAAPRHAR